MDQIQEKDLRQFAAGKLSKESEGYKQIEADLAADPEDGEVARYLKRLEQFTRNQFENIDWSRLVDEPKPE